ncbi:MAG: hypothetical protein K2P88_12290 [Chitinophagaceae bacterium]|nr:hypothetical protein [Chitinophagaceae bacterium]
MLTEQQKQDIVKRLSEKAPNLRCPMCQTNAFSLADGYFVNTMQSDFNSLALGGQAIPTVAIVCNNCGFVSQHAVGSLGLLPKETKNQ